jgi:hypothetical protein
MKNPTLFIVAVVLTTLNFATNAKADKIGQLKAQTQWMSAWNSWMDVAGKNNAQVKMVEAKAKLVTAQSAMVTAQANANKANAEACQAREKAKSMALDNSLKKAETFYGKRALYNSHKFLVKSKLQSTREYSQKPAPKRLTREQLDPISGKINWPSVLEQEQFFEYRVQLDSLFARYIDSSNDINVQVQNLSNQMRDELRLMIREMPSVEYIEAQNFIRSLAYESQARSSQAQG